MPLIIRIDVDNPFNWRERNQKVLNYFSLNWTRKINLTKLGYLKCTTSLFSYLNEHDVPATWFFKPVTLPNKKLLEKISEANHEIALHCVRSDTFENFNSEILKINQHVKNKIRGFSKHGSGSRKLSRDHTMEYDETKLLEFGAKANLKYFIGNGEEPENFVSQKDSISFWSDCFWANTSYRDVEKYSLSWLLENIKYSNLVFLIHPGEWFFDPNIKKTLEWIVKHITDYILPSDIK